MKSKLTLRLDDDLKEMAEQLADERGAPYLGSSKTISDSCSASQRILAATLPKTRDCRKARASGPVQSIPSLLESKP